MPSVYGSAAEGIESGFKMGLRMDELGEERRRTNLRETEMHAAGARAQEEIEIRKKREANDERRLANQEGREATDRAARMLKDRQNDIIAAGKARSAAGMPLDPDAVKEYGANAEALQGIRQKALDYVSRMSVGQVDPAQTDPKEFYTNIVAATGMRPEELQAVPKHIADVQAGLETGNQGLLIQGVNGVMAPRLRKGVGQPSPYGGTIIRKEVIGLDPARDANGVDHPDKFIPRLRVYVKTDKGETKYYDAPATQGGGTDPDDKVNAVSINDAMNYMGQMGTFATAMQHPVLAAKFAEGEKQLSPRERQALDELTALTKPSKVATTENVNLPADSGSTIRITKDPEGKEVKREVLQHNAKPFRPPSGGGGAKGVLQARLDALDDDLADGVITDDEYKEQRRAIVSGIKPAAGGSKGPSNAEQNSAVNGAVEIAAGQLGLNYDPILKQYKNRDGTSATPTQLEKLSAVRSAAIVAVKDAAAKGARVAGEDLTKAAKAGGGAPKYTEGQTATNPQTGAKLVFKGGKWQPVQ